LAVPERPSRDPRFHTPLIEPDWRVWRIRLSDKRSCLRPRQVMRQPRQPNQSQGLVEVLAGEAIGPFALDPVLSALPLAQPIVGVGVDHLIGLGDQPEVEVVCPSGEFEVELLHQFLG
jgi:hypothetical protein